MLEVDGAWYTACATSDFPLYKATTELKESVLLNYSLRSKSPRAIQISFWITEVLLILHRMGNSKMVL